MFTADLFSCRIPFARSLSPPLLFVKSKPLLMTITKLLAVIITEVRGVLLVVDSAKIKLYGHD